MAALNFPANPTSGDQYVENGVIYVWNGSAWTSNSVTNPGGFLETSGGTMTGSLILNGQPANEPLAAATQQYVTNNSSNFTVAVQPPQNPLQGWQWLDSSTGIAYVYNNNQWVSIFAGGATGGGPDKVFLENEMVVTTNYELSSGKSAVSAGPITIQDGVSVTIPDNQNWVIL